MHQPAPPSRSSIEHHPAVSSRLALYYRTLLLSREGLLSREEYCSFHVRLSKLLLAPHFHVALAKAHAEADWNDDMRRWGGGGRQMMDCDTFCHSLFDAMEMFVLLHDAQQVVFMLNKAYTLLTQASSSPSSPNSSSSASSSASPSVVTYLPLASIDAHIIFNAHMRHNVDYNQYAHAAAQSLNHQLRDDDIEFTVPLLPPLGVDPLPPSTAAAKEQPLGGLKHGPTRTGLHCSIGAMDDFISRYSPFTAMLPAQWSVARWQRDSARKQQVAARSAASQHEEEKVSAAEELKEATQPRSRRRSTDTEEPFVVRERRERPASRPYSVHTVTLSGRGDASSSSRRGSVVMDIDDDVTGATTVSPASQREPQNAAQRLSRFIF